MLDISWSLKSCSLFLIQLIWNHVVKKFKTKPFVSTFEAKLHIILAIASLLAYPILQTSFHIIDDRFSTIAPQFVSHLENFLIGIFCFAMSYRFKKLIHQSSGFQTKAMSRIRYYINLNILLGLSVWMDGLFLFTINVDAVHKTLNPTSTFAFIANSKFWLDFCTKLFNFGFIHTYPIAFLILFPYGSGQADGNTTGNNFGTNTRNEDSSAGPTGRRITDSSHTNPTSNATSNQYPVTKDAPPQPRYSKDFSKDYLKDNQGAYESNPDLASGNHNI